MERYMCQPASCDWIKSEMKSSSKEKRFIWVHGFGNISPESAVCHCEPVRKSPIVAEGWVEQSNRMQKVEWDWNPTTPLKDVKDSQ